LKKRSIRITSKIVLFMVSWIVVFQNGNESN
jgi:hypothetical protein